MSDTRDDFVDNLSQQIIDAIRNRGYEFPASVISSAVDTVTQDWVVRSEPVDPIYDTGSGRPTRRRWKITTSSHVETDCERSNRERHEARIQAKIWGNIARVSENAGPPPLETSISEMLNQRTWWIAKPYSSSGSWTAERATEPIRVDDMSHHHRMNLLALLRRRAAVLKDRYTWSMIRGLQPRGDVACHMFDTAINELESQSANEWIEEFPLIRELVYRTTPYGESPLSGGDEYDAIPWYCVETGPVFDDCNDDRDAPWHREID